MRFKNASFQCDARFGQKMKQKEKITSNQVDVSIV